MKRAFLFNHLFCLIYFSTFLAIEMKIFWNKNRRKKEKKGKVYIIIVSKYQKSEPFVIKRQKIGIN